MSYATNAEIERRLGHAVYVQLADDAGTGTADEELVTELRQAAEAEIDAFLSRRFAGPVVTTGEPLVESLLRSLTIDLAVWRLHARRGSIPEAAQARYDGSRRWLEGAACGRVGLPSSGEMPGNTAEGFSGRAVGRARAWSADEIADL